MRSIQISKKLNNTELGKAGTHDTYILVPQNLDISDVFPNIDMPYEFTDRETGEMVTIRHTYGREKRIVGLGPYYSKKELCAGDELILEVREYNGVISRIIDYVKRLDTIVIQKSQYGFDLLTPERKELVETNPTIDGQPLSVEYRISRRKRQDSPEETDYYDVKIGNQSIIEDYSIKEYAIIEVSDNVARIDKFCAWVKAMVETED